MSEDSNNKVETEVSTTAVVGTKCHPDPKILMGVTILVLFAVYVVVLMARMMAAPSASVSVNLAPESPVVPVEKIAKTDLNRAVPTSFSPELLPASATPLEESYTIAYDAGEQATAIFVSPVGLLEQYAMYKDQLVAGGWVIMNSYESEAVYSLYAMKENRELNVTITTATEVGTPGQSQTSISLFNK